MQESCRTSKLESSTFRAVELDDLQVNELLGEIPRRLLAIGLWLRPEGPVHSLLPSLAKQAGCSLIELKKALRLLDHVGLHRYLGRRRLIVPHTPRSARLKGRPEERARTRWLPRLVPCRELGQELAADPRTGLLRTPWGLRAALEHEKKRGWGGARPGGGGKPKQPGRSYSPGWGGKRPGAGRPRKSASTQPKGIKSMTPTDSDSESDQTSQTPLESSKRASRAESKFQTNATPTIEEQGFGAEGPRPESEADPRAELARLLGLWGVPEPWVPGNPVCVGLSRPAPMPSSQASMQPAPLPVVPARRSRLRPKAGVYGSAIRQRIEALGRRLLPPSPAHGLVATVQVPGPALLPADATDAEAVEMLARAYRGAIERTFGTPSMLMLRGKLEEHKDFGRLLLAARLMQAAGIAPAAWVLFSFSVWREHGPKAQRGKHAPPISFVFSKNRLAERVEWFEDQRDRWSGGQMLMAPEHQTLLADYQAMWRELMLRNPQDRAGVMAIMDCWFPGDAWEQRVALARAQAAELKLRVRERVCAGCVLWDEARRST